MNVFSGFFKNRYYLGFAEFTGQTGDFIQQPIQITPIGDFGPLRIYVRPEISDLSCDQPGNPKDHGIPINGAWALLAEHMRPIRPNSGGLYVRYQPISVDYSANQLKIAGISGSLGVTNQIPRHLTASNPKITSTYVN